MRSAERPRAVARLRATLTVLLGVAVMAGLVPATASAGVLGNYPLILDVDLAPNPTCHAPVRGRLAVYFPPGAAVHTDVEWRVRAGDEERRTGRLTMQGSIATAEFELPYAEVPAEAELRVDARVLGSAGLTSDFGKVWRERLARGCDPVRVVAAGDSVVWGQGLDHDQKFPYLTAQRLGSATGRGFEVHNYSISGAVLDAPELPAGNDDSACLREKYPQDPDGDGEMEMGEITQNMPDVFCQLEKAGANARAGGYGIDLVMLDGCVNDIDALFGIPLGIMPGTEDLPAAVQRECSGAGAEAQNPARNVPFFSGRSAGYGGRGMREAIEKAHSLPGHPKVIVVNLYYVYSRKSFPVSWQPCATDGLTAEQASRCRGLLGRAAERFEEYARYSAEAYRQAVEEANAKSADGPYAVATDGLFTRENAVLAENPKLWSYPATDRAASLRAFACPAMSSNPPQCLVAAIGHPNVEGARQYAENFLLNPRLRSWFGLGSEPQEQGFAVSEVSGPPGLTVSFDASVAARRGGQQFEWHFGDGTRTTTSEPVATHTYYGRGPNLPRLVAVDGDGKRTLYEAPRPVVIGSSGA
ncbi:hypothetical protein GCM10012275_17010 [Longimycelium tulufanense]|uniref:PKD domain-containing protein n=1 Tax=Longimycelium tulufanense TaxID=907463 RepID=A0A8J3CCA8_9PSEU|nr:PKD domain-containing protein [Longimycelium tulufanense]GGM46536.1 hypothetical protein GCM10012275_17010 [Longimycelium tulufanense]